MWSALTLALLLALLVIAVLLLFVWRSLEKIAIPLVDLARLARSRQK